MKNYKKIILFSFVSLLTSCSQQTQSALILPDQTAIQTQQSNKNIIHGIYNASVTETLPDDTQGLKHELFMIKIKGGKFDKKIVKVAHDINYAPYVPIEIGSELEIKGDLVTDAVPDMVLHWTHHSDNSSHPDGYIKLKGKIYE